MVIGGRDGSVKGIALWRGVRVENGECAQKKLTSKSKKILARMIRRGVKRDTRVDLAEELRAPQVATPLHNGIYASSTDY